jgi:uncharacterized protein YecE (DUF72 family)
MIRVGVGGWTYEPWRSTFYPKGLTHKRELEYASRKLTSIEINGTFYRTQSAASFAKWRDETPDDFVFSVKAPRYATNRAVLAEAGDSIERFFASGLAELGAKLGPILWQFSAYKRFEPKDFERFLALLPRELGAMRLRHALDVRHKSFATPEFVALAQRHDAAIVFSDTDEFAAIADLTTEFVYARLMRSVAEEPAGYSKAALAAWTKRVKAWESGAEPLDLPRVGESAVRAARRDVFVYFISGAKERAPAAACALLSML